ncbi:ADP-ribosylation factor-like protein 6-interacting protein 1 isoform X2 [Cephus cinctus]|nr:ADP-ribosylation factor-like protein 6-interacting protein 1 isoform X2 [Cephus cinctus]XP_024936591.1 ADP-ribosylation factor-like protein 6-interacting protein 1 isoform X2 [Cephus cinctus]
MECWREIILPLNSILLWERSWHLGLILGVTTSIFMLIWFLEPALLTMISICLLILALVDYLVPILSSAFISTNSWTGQKEKKLDDICQNLSVTILQLQNVWGKILQARNNRPNLYYGSITLCLLLLAWIGNTINNLLLIYMAVNAILLTPGLRHKGRVQKAIKFLCNYMTHRKQS